MPTYLLAIIISDFDFSQAPDGLFEKTVRTYAPPPVIERDGGVYSAEIAAKLLSFFDTYFDTTYPLTKMDSVHVPDFSAGAMENWGKFYIFTVEHFNI
jgi:aminopeptidase N